MGRLNFIAVLFGLVSASSFILFTCRFFSNVLFVSDWLFKLRSPVILLFGVHCDWFEKILPYFKFSSACSVRMFITYCSAYMFSIATPSTGFRLRKSVNFKLLPAMCCIEISNCANRSNHLVSLALYCLLHLFRLISGSSAWWSVYKNTFSRIDKKGIFRIPIRLLAILNLQLSNSFRCR